MSDGGYGTVVMIHVSVVDLLGDEGAGHLSDSLTHPDALRELTTLEIDGIRTAHRPTYTHNLADAKGEEESV